MKTYPVFLIDLRHRRSLVLGGGPEAERKVDGLLRSEASVTLIAAQITDGLKSRVEGGELSWIERSYRPGDLRDAFLVISTESDPTVNARVWSEAEARGALCNVVDDTEHCSFIAGSIVNCGELTLAISTGGRAPALAVRLRQRLEHELGPEYAAFLELASDLRSSLQDRHPDFETRRTLWYRLVDSDVLELLRKGNTERARSRVAEITGC